MKKYYLSYFLFFSIICFSQTSNSDFIQLAEAFHKYHSVRNVDSLIIQKLEKIKSVENDESKDFIIELIKPNNNTLSEKYLKKPNQITLKSVYKILQLNYNMFSANPIANNDILKKIKFDNISEQELLAKYYETLIGNLVNKMDKIDFSIININFENLNLNTKTEKGILFLIVIERLGSYYWGNEYLSEIENSNEIKNIIKRYPKFDNKEYYEYNDFDFDDFLITVDIRKPKTSFKDYFLKIYINTIQSHFKELKTVIE
jgi:hypothetical protein